MEDELPSSGLTITITDRIEDVTERVLNGVTDDMNSAQRQSAISKNINAINRSAEKNDHQSTEVREFYNGNKYYLIANTVYRDVRLVGSLPESLGKFGADTDNWMWPRHNPDFALFRIYAGEDNKPADYSPENIPYKPSHFLPFSISGVKEGDFTMVFGFPGRTSQYLPAAAVDMIANHVNPVKIDIRGAALDVLNRRMRMDEATRLKYASKHAGIANAWKKWIGETQGINKVGAVEKKMEFETEFHERLSADKQLSEKYGNVLSEMNELYTLIMPYQIEENRIYETFVANIDLMRIMSPLARLKTVYLHSGETGYNEYRDRVIPFVSRLLNQFDPDIDKEIFAELIKKYVENAKPELVPEQIRNFSDDLHFREFSEQIYLGEFLDYEGLMELLGSENIEFVINELQQNPALQFAMAINEVSDTKISPFFNFYSHQLDSLQGLFMRAQLELFPELPFFPDANGTLRITYGQVKGYDPRDAVTYKPFTYVEGLMEKYIPGDYEFDLPERFLELMEVKDFGKYADDSGSIPVCFIGTNQTTGGNSGSPALDAKGNFVGINFDRVWEGTMSDLYYDPAICRNIMVDVRFILFLIEKFSNNDRIMNEIKVVEKE
jgi:hypothetical protein